MMRSLIFTLFFSFILTSVSAQSAAIYGRVIDALTQEALVGVTVSIDATSLGGVTDVDGRYDIDGITPGSYNITVSYLGYQNSTRSNVIIQSKGNDDINFEMQEGGIQIATVEVVANPFQTSLETPLSIQRLSPEEIKTYPGGNNDVAKVVQSLPGVSGSIGGFRNDVIIRGGAPNENVYYLDGMEIPNINHFSTQGSAGGPVGMLNVDFIEGVDLATSSFGARYDNVLSGVLQFDQKIGNARERQTNLRVSASETALTTEGPLFKGDKSEANTSYVISARRSYLQFLFELIGLPIRPDYWDYQYKINHKIDEKNTIYLTGIGSIDDFSVKPPSDFSIEQQAVLDQVPIIKQWTTTTGVGWKRLLGESKGVLNTNLSLNILNNNFSAFKDNKNLSGLYLKNLSKETEVRLRTAYTRFLGPWSVTLGANVINADYTNETENMIINALYKSDINFIRYGVFGQVSRSYFGERLNLSIGFRADDNTLSSERGTLFKTLSPRLGLSYALDQSGKWRWNASVGKYYKIAPYTVLGFRNLNGNLVNQDAPYIGSLHLVTGVEYKLGKLGKVSVEAFSKQYDNYPVSIIDGVSLANKGGDFSVLGNEDIVSTGKGRTRGIELLIQQKLTKNFFGILAYTYFKSEFTGLSGDYLPSVWDSRSLLSFTGGYKARRNWEFTARYRYAGRTPYAPVDQVKTLVSYPAVIVDYNRLGVERLNRYNQLDIRIDKKWNNPKFTFNFYLELQNALVQIIPSPPTFGLDRNEEGEIISPQSLIEIPQAPSSLLPIIGFAIDF